MNVIAYKNVGANIYPPLQKRYGIIVYRRLTMIFPVTVLPSSKVTFTK